MVNAWWCFGRRDVQLQKSYHQPEFVGAVIGAVVATDPDTGVFGADTKLGAAGGVPWGKAKEKAARARAANESLEKIMIKQVCCVWETDLIYTVAGLL